MTLSGSHFLSLCVQIMCCVPCVNTQRKSLKRNVHTDILSEYSSFMFMFNDNLDNWRISVIATSLDLTCFDYKTLLYICVLCVCVNEYKKTFMRSKELTEFSTTTCFFINNSDMFVDLFLVWLLGSIDKWRHPSRTFSSVSSVRLNFDCCQCVAV